MCYSQSTQNNFFSSFLGEFWVWLRFVLDQGKLFSIMSLVFALLLVILRFHNQLGFWNVKALFSLSQSSFLLLVQLLLILRLQCIFT